MTGPLDPGTHTVQIDDVPQRYHVAGNGPVCLVHSGGPGIGWEYLRMPQLERSLTLVYVEPIGTGSSGRLADRRRYTLDTYARYVHGVVEHLDVPRVHLIGHSHGGFVAQRFALRWPERLGALVLYATSPVTGPEFLADAKRNLHRYVERNAQRPGVSTMLTAFEQIWSSGDDATFTRLFRAIFPAYFADYWSHEPELDPIRRALIATWDPMCGEDPHPFDTREALAASPPLRTLIVAGQHDYICGPRWAELLAEALPHAERATFEDSGHMLHIEEPERFAAVVGRFVSTV
jgi:pimeloyl-ACP methyl ester carboxylesterase